MGSPRSEAILRGSSYFILLVQNYYGSKMKRKKKKIGSYLSKFVRIEAVQDLTLK